MFPAIAVNCNDVLMPRIIWVSALVIDLLSLKMRQNSLRKLLSKRVLLMLITVCLRKIVPDSDKRGNMNDNCEVYLYLIML